MQTETQTEQAAQWLRYLLASHDGTMFSSEVREHAKGKFTVRTLCRAADYIGVIARNTETFPRRTIWTLPTNV